MKQKNTFPIIQWIGSVCIILLLSAGMVLISGCSEKENQSAVRADDSGLFKRPDAGSSKKPDHQQMGKNEALMVNYLKTLAAAQTDYNNNSSPHTYTGSLACLGSGNGAGRVRFIDPALSSGVKNGYTYSMTAGTPDANGSHWSWSATAWPVTYKETGIRSGYIDETGIVRAGDTGGKPGTIQLPEYPPPSREKHTTKRGLGSVCGDTARDYQATDDTAQSAPQKSMPCGGSSTSRTS
ncbi:hypothetical protein JW979_00145, partial [bacterium]|nr:hypothetical protein [candidate division CSSED10-310 bacterium]